MVDLKNWNKTPLSLILKKIVLLIVSRQYHKRHGKLPNHTLLHGFSSRVAWVGVYVWCGGTSSLSARN